MAVARCQSRLAGCPKALYRHSGTARSAGPGIQKHAQHQPSGFRVCAFGAPRNDQPTLLTLNLRRRAIDRRRGEEAGLAEDVDEAGKDQQRDRKPQGQEVAPLLNRLDF